MSTQTSNLGLSKPDISDTPGVTIPQLASNFDKIDGAVSDIATSIKKFGAKGDGTTDDTQAFLNAVANGGTIDLIEGATYKITGNLTFDVSKVRFRSKGCILNFSGYSGDCLTLIGSASPPYKQVFTVLEGIEIIGSGKSGTSTALVFNTTNGAVSHINFRNLNVHEFSTGMYIGDHSYLTHFLDCDFYNCHVVIESQQKNDSGERISFTGGTIYNSDLILDGLNGSADFFFTNVSMDYCQKYMNIVGSRVFVSQCHIEFSDMSADYLFKTSGGNCGIFITNSMVLANGATGSYGFAQVGNTQDFFVLENCSVKEIPNSPLITGDGHIRVKSLLGAVNPTVFYLPSDYLSVLPDPTLDGSNTLRQFTLTQTGTGTVTVDTSTFASGTQSLKFNMTTITDSCSAAFDVPIQMGDRLFMSWKHKLLNVVAGGQTYQQWVVGVAYYDNFGTKLEGYEDYYSGTTTGFDTHFFEYLQNARVPKGSVKAHVYFSMMGTGTAWVDDIYVNVC